MRLKLVLLVTAAAALALPAAAQGYRDPCSQIRKDRQTAGVVVGGLAGGVLGSNIARKGSRDEGAVLGALLGAVVGAAAGRDTVNCSTAYYGPPPAHTPYPTGPYGAGYGHGPAYRDAPDTPYYPDYPDGYSQQDHRYDEYPVSSRDIRSPVPHGYDIAPEGSGAYTYGGGFEGRECVRAEQITRLPDGSEIRRPVDACRDTYYGGWTIRD